MLHRLRVEDYGLIEEADVAFADGATVFTGETGSGKTMLVGALAFVLGARADVSLVRAGAERARVELTFEPDEALRERLRENGIELEAGEEAAVFRELSAGGKSSVRLCGRSVTAGVVRELAPAIAEIVGQHEAQRLLAPAYHLDMLDRFGGSEALREEVSGAHARAAAARDELERFSHGERDAARRIEEARYARDEIVAAAPELGEDERLTARRRYLDNVERIALAVRGALESLTGDDASAVNALGAAAAALGGVRGVSPELDALALQLAALQSESNDVAAALARALEETEFDPAELEAVNARLDLLDRLRRKYGGSIEAVLAFGADAASSLDAYERHDEIAAQLRSTLASAEASLRERAEALTAARTAAARALEKKVRREFADLALASGDFVVRLEPLPDIGRTGAERAEFLFSANAGEAARPLGKIVSGGELSRVLLALVVAVAGAREPAALVFDEIDAGIGGATAVAVGTRIGRLAKRAQVVCITHLAQIATWGARHYVLEKEERRGGTVIGIREVATSVDRTKEVARMLSGETRAAALQHARELLEKAAR